VPECVFIGSIRTPYKKLEECPRNVQEGGAVAVLELNTQYAAALIGLDSHEYIEVLYWLDRARRDLLIQKRREDGKAAGTFALRSPNRPNPIGTAVVKLVKVSGSKVYVEGLDCLDGTRLLDIKPAMVVERGRQQES
jgi:tRNA-Thr(GGU) m(6)t(6)A37 methyltransferase TsaA